MTQIVCQVSTTPDQVSFTWSDGVGFFEPYHLRRTPLQQFRQAAENTRRRLRDLVLDCLPRSSPEAQRRQEDDIRRSSLELARAGRELHRSIFDPGLDGSDTADEVLAWLGEIGRDGAELVLEIVMDGERLVPWTVVYEHDPDEQAFLSGDASSAHWQGFWGIRYNLAGGRKVDPLRRKRTLDPGNVLLVVDPQVRDDLGEPARGRLLAFADRPGHRLVCSRQELEAALAEGRPVLMYWFCHATPEALVLGGDEIRPLDLYKMLSTRGAVERRTGGVAFLNACQTAEADSMGSFLDALYDLGLSGLIATEEQTIDVFANELGLEFLERFLAGEAPVGRLMQELRTKVPLGLLYSTYCPPDLRVQGEGQPPAGTAEPIQVGASAIALRSGKLLGAVDDPVLANAVGVPLPELPYRSLGYYDRQDRALFTGREEDVERFAQILDDPASRIVVLHGESGVGKTSFLRAGLIPFLEEQSIGYGFLRDHSGTSGGIDEALFVRATNDLAGQLGQALHDYAAATVGFLRPEHSRQHGERFVVPLFELLEKEAGGSADPARVASALRRDPGLLGRVLHAFGQRLPFTPVLVIDQAEELFTLPEPAGVTPSPRHTAMEILRGAASGEGEYRIILSLRTEYYGRLVEELRVGSLRVQGVREYMLTDITPEKLARAIALPTSREPIPHTLEIPFARYGFDFEDGLPERIADEIFGFASQRHDSVLPLAQVICTQLWDRARQRRERTTITAADLDTIGGVAGGMSRHVANLVERLFPSRGDRQAFRHLFVLGKLYRFQPDGNVTSALVPEHELAQRWRGRMPFERMLEVTTRGEHRLLRVSLARVGEHGRERYVSLGHDALARVVAAWAAEHRRRQKQWAEERQRRRRQRIWQTTMGIAVLIIVVMTYLWVSTMKANSAAAAATKEAQAQRTLALARLAAARAPMRSAREPDLGVLLAVTGFQYAEELGASALEIQGDLLRTLEEEPRLQTLLPGHAGGVRYAAFSPDARLIATGDSTPLIRIWDVARRTVVDSLRPDVRQPVALAFVGNSSTLAVVSARNVVTVWNLAGHRMGVPWRFAPEQKFVFGGFFLAAPFAFSRDGSHMASASGDSIWTWDTATGTRTGGPWVLPDGIRVLAYSPDGTYLAAGGDAGHSYAINISSGSIRPFEAGPKSDDVVNLAFSEDEGTVAVADFGGKIHFFDPSTGRQRGPSTRIRVTVPTAIQIRGDLLLVSNTWTETIDLYHLKTRRWLERPLRGHAQSVSWLTVAPRGRLLASGGMDDYLALWDLDARSRIGMTAPSSGPVASVAFAIRSGKPLLALGSPDSGRVLLWEPTTGRSARVLPAAGGFAQNLVFSSDGGMLAGGDSESGIRSWDVDHSRVLGPDIPGEEGFPSNGALAFSPNGRVLAYGAKGVIRLWNVATRRLEHTILIGDTAGMERFMNEDIMALRFRPDGDTLLAVEEFSGVSFWNPSTGKAAAPRFRMDFHIWARPVLDQSGRLLAEGAENLIRLWDLRTRRQLGPPLTGHPSTSYTLAFSPGGTLLASGAANGTLALWDLRSQVQFGPVLSGHRSRIVSLSFAPDGRWLASASQDSSTIVWNLDPHTWIAAARRMINRNLTCEEWKRYFPRTPYRPTFPDLPSPPCRNGATRDDESRR